MDGKKPRVFASNLRNATKHLITEVDHRLWYDMRLPDDDESEQSTAMGQGGMVTNTTDGRLDDYFGLTPSPDMMFNETHLMVICCYSIVFLFAAVGNLTMLLILLRNLRKAKLNRVYTLLLNLNVADMLVTFFHMPKEIIHAATVQWYGPDWLCRLSKYLDVFGIYLSSNVLICLSIDRFIAIVRPLYSFTASNRVRFMIIISWVVAAASSLPQVYTFCKATHPIFEWYSQCIALPIQCGTGNSTQYVLINTALNALEIYILPFLVIVVCYGTILASIVHEARYASQASSSARNNPDSTKLSLRRSSYCYIRRAKSKTLRMTIVIVVTFLICWSPYFIMVSLHFADLNLATGQRYNKINLHPAAEKFLYIFAIFNSCINPYLYGFYSFKLKPELEALFDIACYYCCCWFFWCPHRKMRMQETKGRYMRTLSTPQRTSTMTRNASRTSRGLSLDMGTGGVELTVVDDNGTAVTTAAGSAASSMAATNLAISPQESPRDVIRRNNNNRKKSVPQQQRGGKKQKPPRLLVNSKAIGGGGGGGGAGGGAGGGISGRKSNDSGLDSSSGSE